MDGQGLIEYHRAQLERLCPPFDAGALGGAPEGERDDLSDIDCFLLASDQRLSELIKMLPFLLEHPAEPITRWDRGWHPGFGYQYTYIYPGGWMADYFVNSPRTLTPTAMARKTRLLVDRTGDYTAFLASLAGHPALSADSRIAVWGETSVELLRIRKYVIRGELCAVAHRLERLRLVLLALERVCTLGEPYNPHDADKRVDLRSSVGRLIAKTFAAPRADDLAAALTLLHEAIMIRLDGSQTRQFEGQNDLQTTLLAEIQMLLRG